MTLCRPTTATMTLRRPTTATMTLRRQQLLQFSDEVCLIGRRYFIQSCITISTNQFSLTKIFFF